MSEKVKSTLIVAAIVLGISLVEIFLMLRASFLSRVKEVGTLRAIGLKRIDICRMFLGEIIAITLLTAPAAFAAVGYVLSGFTNYAYLANRYVMDWRVVAISAAIVLVSNLLAGLLPVIWTVRKTPAQILARTDVD
jgi:ABC-type antimicrobial peptide transport system permease subunit